MLCNSQRGKAVTVDFPPWESILDRGLWVLQFLRNMTSSFKSEKKKGKLGVIACLVGKKYDVFFFDQ